MATKTKKKLSEAEIQAKRDAERELVKAAVAELETSDGWVKWLSTRSRFRKYSFGNQLLIALQNPEAVRVTGFKKWLELGYCVRKGEKAIKIWAPLPPSKKAVEAFEKAKARGEECEAPRMFFKLVPVFGDNQVDALPAPAEPADLFPPNVDIAGDDLAPVWGKLVKLAKSYGVTVSKVANANGAKGFYKPATKEIAVVDEGSVNGQVRVLVHEVAHALVRLDKKDGDPKLDYASEELVVESVAFTVCGSLGVDTAGSSIPYIAGWAGKDGMKALEAAAKLTDRLAGTIEQAVE
jgi:antirestriction protein ArdC